MDEPYPARSAACTFAPSAVVAWAMVGGALLAAFGAYLGSDPPGRVLLVVVALVLAGLGGTDLVLRPRLSVNASGLAILTPTIRSRIAWAEIDVVRVDERAHHGLANRALELEVGDRLVVFSRRSLGCDLRVAFAEISRLRPS